LVTPRLVACSFCSSKRAAQISHNVSALSDAQHSQSQYHLPQIGGGGGGGGGAYAQVTQICFESTLCYCNFFVTASIMQ
jgi:hypothetical protein